ncbi:MAG: ABC transporter ATP-binding protein [Gammaproteobacteria bacterium]|nr:ABC transporter ATP-binding protein [Gammaproteobacteria bacterium]
MSDMLRVEAITLRYPGAPRPVIVDLDLALFAGEIGCLLGASGCGKTSVLRAIAGFEPLQKGCISLGGRLLAQAGFSLPPEQRQIGTMFQDYALFPHLSAADNVAFGLRKLDRPTRQARVAQLLDMVDLHDRGGLFPHQLSGGQQQRVALARALAAEPALLLLDEPFSNLDVDTRSRLLVETRQLLKARGLCALMVSHDPAEAMAMSDRIAVMAHGQILQFDRPQVLYEQPAHPAVAESIGGGWWLKAQSLGLPGDDRIRLRNGQIGIDPTGPLRAQCVADWFSGPEHRLRLRLATGEHLELSVAVRDVDEWVNLRLLVPESALLRFPPL